MKGEKFSLNGIIALSRKNTDKQKIITVKFEVNKNTECKIYTEGNKKILLLKNLTIDSI